MRCGWMLANLILAVLLLASGAKPGRAENPAAPNSDAAEQPTTAPGAPDVPVPRGRLTGKGCVDGGRGRLLHRGCPKTEPRKPELVCLPPSAFGPLALERR